jgi:hypothetical protein
VSSLWIALASFVCCVGGVLAGRRLRSLVPERDIQGDAKDGLKVAAGMLATLTALVLGLLVSSAKSAWDDVNDGLVQLSAKVVLLDRALAKYGPETQKLRGRLRESVTANVRLIWSGGGPDTGGVAALENSNAREAVDDAIRALAPKTDEQRDCRAEALSLAADLRAKRWQMIARYHTSTPLALLVALDAWLAVFFASIGLLTPPSRTVSAALGVCGVCVASAILLVVELSRPLDGLLKVSDEPLEDAIAHIGR